MTPKILLVNPPIYDFTAYDFWLKPYGLLSIAGYLRGKADFVLFDYLDRCHPAMATQKELRSDKWGRGRFYCERISTPTYLKLIPRYYRRFGLPRSIFTDFLKREGPFDFAFIQTMMTYWYEGIREVIEDIRQSRPSTKIILGGNYITFCKSHAEKLGADFLSPGINLESLWKYIGIEPDTKQPTLWQAYNKLNVGVLKLSEGCPFSCTYCSVPNVYGKFKARPLERSLAELELLVNLGVQNIAFYDDALLFEAEKVLVPFLKEVIKRNIKMNFHTPNGLHARFINKELAELMIRAGFKTFYIGFESNSLKWQQKTGSKVFCDELTQAVEHLISAGAKPEDITAYQILGHPYIDAQQLEATMHFVNSLGIRGTLADFSPIPGTPDGEYCRKWVDLDEPLMHNKTAFPVIMLGFEESNRLKELQRKLNRNISVKPL
ncbi:MAG: hypothetical protein A2167_00140 [Planctomycetes bacterium RBG_13_46_10]|nr:MAG: hypothetical protein A2167_00140 [Planctomycetes bacterium RBG_13_46_10]